MPRRIHSAFAVAALPIVGLSWWLLPRSTPAAPPPPVPPPPPSQAPFGVWRGPYTMQPAGLWEEVGTLELQVTRQLVEDNPVTRAYRVAARLRSSRFGLLNGSGAIRQEKAHPERGWVLDRLGADGGTGVQVDGRSGVGALSRGDGTDRTDGTDGTDGTEPSDRSHSSDRSPSSPSSHPPGPTPQAQGPTPLFPSPTFEITPSPGSFWDGATIAPRLVMRTWYGVAAGAPRYALAGDVTLGRRTDPIPRPAAKRQIEVRVERPELPPSDLRRAIENLATPESPEATLLLPPTAEETAVRVWVRSAAGRPLAGERVRIQISPATDSGGHSGEHSGTRPHGWLLPEEAVPVRPGGPRIGSLEPELLGTTDAAGELRLRYRAPELGGVETLSAELVHDPETRAFVELRVGLPLVALPANPDYFLVGGTFAHPSADNDAGTSHFVTPAVLAKLAAVAADFRRATGLPLRVNDSSLPWGGVFDIDGGWERPHYNHRDGTDIDLAVSGYPATGARQSAPAVGPSPALLFRAPVFGPPVEPPPADVRGLAMSEVELLAAAVRRQGGRPGFEGDHIHASFGPIRFAEGPPRPKVVPEEGLSPELKALLDTLELLPYESMAPTAPSPTVPTPNAAPVPNGRQPAGVAPLSEPSRDARQGTVPVKPSDGPSGVLVPKPGATTVPSGKPVTEPAAPKEPANSPAPPAAKPPAFDPTAPLAPPTSAPAPEKVVPTPEKEKDEDG